MKNNSRKKVKIATIFSVLWFIVFVLVAVLLITQIKKKNIASIQTFSEAEGQLNAFYKASDQKKVFKETEQQRAQLARTIINKDSSADFFRALEEIAGIANVSFDVISAVVDDTLDTEFEVEGSFYNVYTFFRLLETLPFGITVVRAELGQIKPDIVNEDEETAPILWQGIFDIRLFSYQSE